MGVKVAYRGKMGQNMVKKQGGGGLGRGGTKQGSREMGKGAERVLAGQGMMDARAVCRGGRLVEGCAKKTSWALWR